MIFLSHREDDDDLWEPFNAEVLAQHGTELSKDDLDELAQERAENEEDDGEGEIVFEILTEKLIMPKMPND
jgi:hypothetical protein